MSVSQRAELLLFPCDQDRLHHQREGKSSTDHSFRTAVQLLSHLELRSAMGCGTALIGMQRLVNSKRRDRALVHEKTAI